MPGRASGDSDFAAGAPCMAVGNFCDRAQGGALSFDSASPHPSGSLSAVHLRCAPVRPSGCRARPLRSRRRESALAIGRGRRHRPWRACCWACCRSGAYSQACSLPVRNAHQNPPDSQSRARTQPPDVAIPSGFASSCHAPCPRQQPKGRWAGETLTLQQPQHRGTVLGSLINLTHEPAYLGYSALAQKTRCGSVEGLPYIEAAGLKQNPKTPTISLHPRPHLSAHRQRHVPGRRVPRRPAPRKNMDW